MPRSIAIPDFPDTPGGWLASYRFRQHSDVISLSPEQLGERIGVSGATVRRWETGRSKPHQSDIHRLSVALELTSLEREFLTIAFKAAPDEEPPSPKVFTEYAKQVLDSPFPALLMDSFYFVRAYNSYNTVLYGAFLSGRAHPPQPMHIFQRLGELSLLDGQNRIQTLIQSFWFNTAGLCGSAAYKLVLQHLRAAHGFEEEWRALALDRERAPCQPLNTPNYLSRPEIGTFRAHNSTLTIPPIYYLREHVPVDEFAQQRLNDLRKTMPSPTIVVDSKTHWSQEDWAPS